MITYWVCKRDSKGHIVHMTAHDNLEDALHESIMGGWFIEQVSK